ncbi:hypothetical protein TRICI_000525 [Trichomonascus ciferrii]|uniref:Uncharacterized protein n=1 Tax=Trichomonascus ciferrii TaxID=44093 RepID=A0A642VD66_9ASCO|nr:hypothetical protein TRICI_000525 [Trichomonascus ciferrii]
MRSILGCPRGRGSVCVVQRVLYSTARACKGTRFWHSRYTGENAVVRPEYRDLFALFEKFQEQPVYGNLKNINNLLIGGDAERALCQWKLALERQLQVSRTKESVRDFPNRQDQLSPRAINIFIEILLHQNKGKLHGGGLFDMFWTPLTRSPVVVEFIPELILGLCIRKKLELAYEVILHIDDTVHFEHLDLAQQRLYKEGLVNGLNCLLYAYFRSGATMFTNTRSKHWREVYTVLNGFNNEVQLQLYPHIWSYLHRRVPKFTYTAFFKLLLSRKVDFRQREASTFLKNVFASSEQAKSLVLEAQQRNVTDQLFRDEVYEFMFRHLARHRAAEETAYLLEDRQWLGSQDPRQTRWALLLYRAIEIDGIQAAGVIYDLMIENGVEPTIDTMLTIFRGFRLNAMESKCMQVVDMVVSRGWKLNRAFCTDLLTLISDRYGPAVVVQYYKLLFPQDSEANLEQTGISNYLRNHRYLPPTNLPYTIDPKTVSTDGHLICDAALNIVYRSILNNEENLKTINYLYRHYKWFVLYHRRNKKHGRIRKISLKVLDLFISNLCIRLKSRSSIDLADSIFRDAITTIPFAYNRKPFNSSRSLAILCMRHCSPIRQSENTYLRPQVEKAIELIRLSQNYDFIPITAAAFEPIIRHYLGPGNDIQTSEKWFRYASQLGASIRDPQILNALPAV